MHGEGEGRKEGRKGGAEGGKENRGIEVAMRGKRGEGGGKTMEVEGGQMSRGRGPED